MKPICIVCLVRSSPVPSPTPVLFVFFFKAPFIPPSRFVTYLWISETENSYPLYADRSLDDPLFANLRKPLIRSISQAGSSTP